MKKGIVLFIVCLLFLCCSCKSKGQHRIEVIVERNQAGNASCLDFIDDNPRVAFNYSVKDKAAEPEKRVSFLGQTLQGHYNKSCKIVDSMIDFYQTDEKEGGLEFSVDRKNGTVGNILCCEIDMTFYTNGELLAYSNYQEYNNTARRKGRAG
jgi:hypothetical protein